MTVFKFSAWISVFALTIALVTTGMTLFEAIRGRGVETSFSDIFGMNRPRAEPFGEAESVARLREQIAAQQREIDTLRDELGHISSTAQGAAPSAEIAALRADLDRFSVLVTDRPEDVLSNLQVRADLGTVKDQVSALRDDIARANSTNLTIGFSMAGLILAMIGIMVSNWFARRQNQA